MINEHEPKQFDYWENIAVLATEIRDAIDNNFMPSTVKLLEDNFMKQIKNKNANNKKSIN